MPVKPQTYIIHPETGKSYLVKDAAKLIGIETSSVYTRLRQGDTGKRLWRPKDDQLKFEDYSDRSDLECTKKLRKIPKATKFDLMED